MNLLNNTLTDFLDELKHPLRNEIEHLRSMVLNVMDGLSENFKWNGPNYSFKNEDRVTMKIQPPKAAQLIFQRGVKVQTAPDEKLLNEHLAFLIWKGTDRAIITFNSSAEIENRKEDIAKIIKDWIEATS